MALQLSTDFNGINIPNAYYKIAWKREEDYLDETNTKKYRIEGGLHMFSDSTKIGVISGESFSFSGVNIDDISYEGAYNLIKTMDKFKTAINT